MRWHPRLFFIVPIHAASSLSTSTSDRLGAHPRKNRSLGLFAGTGKLLTLSQVSCRFSQSTGVKNE
jgi:hypothetical protein